MRAFVDECDPKKGDLPSWKSDNTTHINAVNTYIYIYIYIYRYFVSLRKKHIF